MDIQLSPLDEEHFGIKTARVNDVRTEHLSAITEFCTTHNVKLLIARTAVDQLRTVQTMETMGYLLMDTLVYYGCTFAKMVIPDDTREVEIRSFQPDEKHRVQTIAADAFRGYFGHYHADERLDRDKCDEVYQSWAINSALADEVLVAVKNSVVQGFVTLQLKSRDVAEIRLFAVASEAQRQGVAHSMMLGAMRWCDGQGVNEMMISTQITNFPVQKVWVRVGLELRAAHYTFHKWFD